MVALMGGSWRLSGDLLRWAGSEVLFESKGFADMEKATLDWHSRIRVADRLGSLSCRAGGGCGPSY